MRKELKIRYSSRFEDVIKSELQKLPSIEVLDN